MNSIKIALLALVALPGSNCIATAKKMRADDLVCSAAIRGCGKKKCSPNYAFACLVEPLGDFNFIPILQRIPFDPSTSTASHITPPSAGDPYTFTVQKTGVYYVQYRAWGTTDPVNLVGNPSQLVPPFTLAPISVALFQYTSNNPADGIQIPCSACTSDAQEEPIHQVNGFVQVTLQAGTKIDLRNITVPAPGGAGLLVLGALDGTPGNNNAALYIEYVGKN